MVTRKVDVGGFKVSFDALEFSINEDTIVIYNVPIAAEMVQRYSDGNAYKPAEVIFDIQVDQVPLTIVSDAPSHPRDEDGRLKHIGEMSSVERAKFVVGFMTEPSRPRADMKEKKKRYADFVIHRTPKTKALEDKLRSGERVDTSIGFSYEHIGRAGRHEGQPYDYIQSGIILDHNAILIDASGRLGVGRAPNPIAGIGADSNQTEENTMSSEEMKKLQAKVDEAEAAKEEAEKKAEEAVKEAEAKVEEAEKKAEDALNQLKERKAADEDLRAEFDEYKARHEKYAEYHNAAVKKARDSLSKAYPAMADFISAADENAVLKKYDELQTQTKAAPKKHIGADMLGNKESKKSVDKAYSNYAGQLNKEE